MNRLRVILVIPQMSQLGIFRRALQDQPDIVVCGVQTSLIGIVEHATRQNVDLVCVARDLGKLPEFEQIKHELQRAGVFSMLLRQCSGCTRIAVNGPLSCADTGCRNVAGDIWGLVSRMTRVVANKEAPPASPKTSFVEKRNKYRMILIGSSTGGVDALERVLSHFSERCPPTAIVQHTGAKFGESLTRYLSSRCAARVVEAKKADRMVPGTVYVAASSDHHLELTGREHATIDLRMGPRVSGHRPSVDAMFQSATRFGDNVVAALLTGMGRDGAEGLLALRKAGATTFAQDEETSVVYGMPRVAWEIGAVGRRLSINAMGPALLEAATIAAGSTKG